jgi:nicotinate phosphoribosyltransferase
MTPTQMYRPDLALLTDLYELTMACGYLRTGVGEREASFSLFFRRNPFGGGYTLAAGLADALDVLENFRFSREDLAYLAGLAGNDGAPLFDGDFLARLGELSLSCDVDAIPEGTVVFPYEPLVRVTGPIFEAQLVETFLLTMINFQTLIATKAARICQAARGDPVIEFGLRRAQGIDGGLAASRAAYVGGCAGTSNVLAGRLYGIPVKGTHAHSWVMSFDDELAAFRAYAIAMPNNCVFLVDTYDSLEGVHHAMEVGRELRARGHDLAGIRLDSGDLAYLSVQARKLLDEAGFERALIVGSNELDEQLIESLKEQGAAVNVWGVGTRLATAWSDPALGGVYKLTAVRNKGEAWQPRIKLSEQRAKLTNPGILGVRRYRSGDQFVADALYDALQPPPAGCTIVDPLDETRFKVLDDATPFEELLVPVLRNGERVYDPPPLETSRARGRAQLAGFHAGIKRFVNPHPYPVGLERSLSELKTRLVFEARAANA